MKTFYSIVSIATNPQLDEKFGVGLLCVDEKGAHFYFSEDKLRIVSRLITSEAKNLVKSSLVNIKEAIEVKATSKGELAFDNISSLDKISASYISYLSRYNNNLLQFSAPTQIDLKIDQKIFQKLFHKFIYSKEDFSIKSVEHKLSISSLKKPILEKAKSYVNINFDVTNEHIKGLITPKTVDMIGKNGSYNIAHAIDFNTTFNTLNHNLDYYMHLALSTELVEDEHAFCFLIGSEPAKRTKNHQIWKNVKSSKQVEFVSFDESDKVIEHFKNTGVEPLVSE